MNVLVFKPGAIGDLLHITPAVRALKALAENVSVSIMVGTRFSANLFRGNPLVDEVIVFDRKGEHATWGALLGLWRQLRAKRFDLVLNYQRSNLKGWFLATAAMPCRVLVYHKSRRKMVHAVVDHLRPLEALGVDPYSADRKLDFFPSAADEEFAERFIAGKALSGKRLVVFNPGTTHAVKCWPAERYAVLGDRLADGFGCAIAIVGSREERPLADVIRGGMRHAVHDLCGCSLGELGALLRRAEFLVTGDTGPMHIASAVGARVLALYGPISPERSGPIGEGHRIVMHGELECCPCNRFECRNPTFRLCMEMITVEEVAAAAAEMLRNTEGRG